MYPNGVYAAEIAAAVIELQKVSETASVELLFNDADMLTQEEDEPEIIDDIDDEATELDDLLDDDLEDEYEDKNGIKTLKTSIKVAEDELLDIEDDA